METLRVATAIPYLPFIGDDGGLDIDLITALAEHLGATTEFVDGSSYDCITGVVVTPERATATALLPPYVISGQALAVDTRRHPRVRSVDDLEGLTIGIPRGDTSQAIADNLVADGRASAVRPYDTVADALTDLSTGACDAVMTLAPVLAELVTPIPRVEVVQRGITVEHIAIGVAPDDQALLGRLTVAQAELEADGTLQRFRRKWLGNPYADQNLTVH